MEKWFKMNSQPHKEVFGRVYNIKKNQQSMDDLDERHFRLYSGLPLYSAFTFNLGFDAMDAKFTMNVVQSAVNTMVSKITKNKVKPTFLTDGANWGMQEEAKKLDKYVYGQFYKSKAYAEAKKAFRDACIFGDGILKRWHDKDGNITFKRVFKPCIIVDQGEVIYGNQPTEIFEVRIVSKDVLKEKHPDFSREIEDAKITDLPFFVDSIETAGNLVVVIEAHKAGYYDEKDVFHPGKHFIGISTATMLYEDFKQDKIPYHKISFMPNPLGWWSRGIAELLTGHQVEINRTLMRISRAMNLMSSPNILIDYMSDIIETHFDNDVGTIIKYKNQPPMYNFPQGINPMSIEWLFSIYQKAFEEVGLSQLSAQAKKPEGLNSGKALREFNDIETERFAEVAQAWEDYFLELADGVITESKTVAQNGGKTVVMAPDKFGADTIDFKKISLKDTQYVMQVYPTSMLPKTPAGRLEYVQEMMGSGLVTPEEGLSLLEFPDIKDLADTKNAYMNDIKYTAFLIISKAEYMPPEPYQNLDFGIQYMNSMYLMMKVKQLPEERLGLLQKWINDAISLKESMMPQPENPMDAMAQMPTEEIPQDMTEVPEIPTEGM